MAEHREVDRTASIIGRRQFLSASAMSVGLLAVASCTKSRDEESPETTAIPRRVYSTNFDLTECPIAEGGAWSNAGQLWTPVRTANGWAYGTNGARNTYDDSYAYLSGFSANQQVEAVVYVSPTLTGSPHEVELLLRWADSAQTARGYECLFNFQGGCVVVRWNGPFGDFTEISPVGSIHRPLVSGDVIRATIVENTITCQINNTRVATAMDNTWTDGQPGIGFFKRTSGLNSDFALTSFAARSL